MKREWLYVTAVILILMGAAIIAVSASAHASVLPHTEWHACHMFVLWSRHQATAHAALSAHADPDLHRAIVHAVRGNLTPGAFWHVMSLCGYGL